MTGHQSKRVSDSRFGDAMWGKPAVIELLESRRLMDAVPSLGDFLESAASPWGGSVVAGIARSSTLPACAVQDDGRIVVAVRGDAYVGGELSTYRTIVFRLNADLSLDTSFGVDGRVSLPMMENRNIVAIEDDGQILVAGAATTTPWDNGADIAIVRLNSDGTIDTTFGTDGMAVLPDTNRANDDVVSMAVLPNGQIMVVGNACYRAANTLEAFEAWWDSDRGDVMVYRLNADGQLDTTYNGSGWVQIDYQPGDMGGNDWADAKIAADGSVVLSIGSWMGPWDTMTLERHLTRVATDGSVDTQFEQYTAPIAADDSLGISFAPAANGEVFVLTQSYSTGPVLWRIGSNGAEVLPFEYAGPGSAQWVSIPSMSVDDTGRLAIVFASERPVATQWVDTDGQTIDTVWYEQQQCYDPSIPWHRVTIYAGTFTTLEPDGSLLTIMRTDFGRYLQPGEDRSYDDLAEIWVRRWDLTECTGLPDTVVDEPVTPVDPPTIPDPVIPEPPIVLDPVVPIPFEPPVGVDRPYIPVVPPPTGEVIYVPIVIECPIGTPEVVPEVVADSGQDSGGATDPVDDFDDTVASEEVIASEDDVLAGNDGDVLDQEMDELLM